MDSKLIWILGGGALLWYLTQPKTAAATGTGTGTGVKTSPLTTLTPAQIAAIQAAAAGNQQQTMIDHVGVPPVEAPAGNTLSAIYSRMQAAANTSKMVTGSPDQWNWLLASVSSLTPPDPMEVWPTYDRTAGMTLSLDQYWAVMSAYLRSARGMSGLGFRRQKSYSHPAHGWVV